MGGGQSAPPAAPTFNSSQVSNDQIKANANAANTQARINNVNQVTPFGNLTYNQTGGQLDYNGNWIPSYTATTDLTPETRNLVNQWMGLQGQQLDLQGQTLNAAGTQLNQIQNQGPFSYKNLPGLTLPNGNQQDYQNRAYDALMARQNQALDLQQKQLDAKLANQGVGAGSDAYNNAYRPLEQARVDAPNQALLVANQLAGQNINQATELFNTSLANRHQTEAEQLQQYEMPYQNYSTLMGLGTANPGIQMPNYVNTPQTNVQAADVTAPAVAAYQGQLSTYNQQLQNYYNSQNATMGGLFGLGGSVLGGLGQAAGKWAFGLL